jgi:NADPH-dependent glutamate synthase beta subunit-like oxidoreductase
MNSPRNPPPTTWTTGTTEVFKTGTWRASLPRYISAPSPCHAACPVGGEIARWIGLAREGDLRGAWEILVRNNPFPAVAGRVCHHPCEAACNRAGFDQPLAICRLERHVGDAALAAGWPLPGPQSERSERVAVVGGGPSGLAAAYQLRRRGYAVTLLEARPQLGGLMRDGIPAYRLPRAVLDGEIERIVALGIELRLGQGLDSAQDFARLREEFDAVYLATGARRQKRMAQLDYGKTWVMDGADWLARANAGTPPVLGRALVVIGGGSAAIDVARSARRIGHDVTLLALEREHEMPAQREEVEEALEEGVQLVDGAMLERVRDAGGGGLVLECTKVNFSGSIERIPGSGFDLEADAVVSSIGQDPELSALSGALRTDGALLFADARQATSVEGVYAGGDLTSTARFITEAIGMGKRAAQAIEGTLAGEARRPVTLDAIATFYYPRQARQAAGRIEAAERLAGEAEVQLGFDAAQALAESERCFSCGECIFCDNCFYYCPDLAVNRVPDGYAVNGDYCKGCGMCVRECPTGSMEMVEELR